MVCTHYWPSSSNIFVEDDSLTACGLDATSESVDTSMDYRTDGYILSGTEDVTCKSCKRTYAYRYAAFGIGGGGFLDA